jgi:hypothetical protein
LAELASLPASLSRDRAKVGSGRPPSACVARDGCIAAMAASQYLRAQTHLALAEAGR